MDPLTVLDSLFGGKLKHEAAVVPKVKLTTNSIVKPVTKAKIALSKPTSKTTAAKKEWRL